MLLPPGTGVWVVAAGPTQLPLVDIVCVWNMGANYADITSQVAVLNSTVTHEITFGYAQADVGTQTVHVNCSNRVSSQNVTMDVTVVWDNVTLGQLACNSSTLWNHSITCQLTVVRFGTGACFEWDMGDGEPAVYYRDGYCADYVPASASASYVQVRSATVFRCNSPQSAASWWQYCWYYTVGHRNVPPNFCPYLRQILTDFENSSTVTLCGQLAITWLLNIPPRLSCIATLPSEI